MEQVNLKEGLEDDFLNEEHIKIKDEPIDLDEIDESQAAVQDNESLDLKSEVEEEQKIPELQFDHILDSVLSPSHSLRSTPSPEPTYYQRPPPTAPSLTISKKSRKETYQVSICPQCGIKLCSELERQEHLMTAHDPTKKKKKIPQKRYLKPSPPAVEYQTEWMCPYCSKYFESKFDMLMHRRREHQRE